MLHPEGDAISLLLLDISDGSFHLFRNAKRSTRDRILVNRRKVWSDVCRGAYLYEVGKEQDVGGGRPHVSPWGIPRLPHIIDIPCCCSSAALSSTPPRSRWILHCPLVTPFPCILRALSLSLTTLTEYYRSLLSAHCTPQILPVRAPTPNIHWRVSFAWKDDLSSFSLSTKHS